MEALELCQVVSEDGRRLARLLLANVEIFGMPIQGGTKIRIQTALSSRNVMRRETL